MVPPQTMPRFSPLSSCMAPASANTSSWIGESLIEVLSRPEEGAGLGDRVRSVDSLSGGATVPVKY